MSKRILLFLSAVILSCMVFAQDHPLHKFENLIGTWEGTGEGFGAATSVIQAEYSWLMNKHYIQLKHRSEFGPTTQNPKGETHEDLGIISYDSGREKIVCRQYHNEGFYNEYILVDSLSTEKILVFDTEKIENFVPGGRARLTFHIKSDSEIETVFEVGFPGKEMACFGKNKLIKQ